MRGKRHALVGQIEHLRIIPARAGQTATPKAVVIIPPDHPRACGANSIVLLTALGGGGSSPRVRGKPRPMRVAAWRARIIPARAGQTRQAGAADRPGPDHPRACGANDSNPTEKSRLDGSSPRVRGKPGAKMRFRSVHRIIPARAGQTRRPARCCHTRSDHPRACGANQRHRHQMHLRPGSSPRVRGKPPRFSGGRRARRIIPARAGQTVRFYAKTLERWTLNNWIRTVAPIFVLLFLLPVIGQNAYIERHYSNQSFSWFSKLHYASAFDLSLVA